MNISEGPTTSEENIHEAKILAPLTKEGMWAASTTGFGENYLAPCAIALGASTFQLGLLGSFPSVVNGLSQLLGLRLTERGVGRRKACRRGAFVQALLWLPLGGLLFLPMHSEAAVQLFLVVAALYFALGGMIAPIWSGLIGDIIPPAVRARYLGERTRRITIVSLFAFILSGIFLEYMKYLGHVWYGFLILFTLACWGRIQSSKWLGRYEDPPYIVSSQENFTFRQFLLKMENANFARFVLFVSMFNFASSISSVYIPLYMLRDAQLTYLQFMMIEAMFLMSQSFSFSRWGQLMETYGAKRILVIAAVTNAVIPFMFLASSGFFALMLVRTVMGFVWSGYALSSSAFLFDAVTPKHRARCAAYQAVVNSLLVFLGAAVGALLAKIIPTSEALAHPLLTVSSSLPTVFLISGIFRLAMLPFLSSFKEVRKVATASHLSILFRASPLRPVTATILAPVMESGDSDEK